VKGKGDHLPLGTGKLDLPKYFYLANKHNCRVVLETKTVAGLKELVQWINEQKTGHMSVTGFLLIQQIE